MITRPSTGTLFRPRKREIGLSRSHVGQITSCTLGVSSGVIPERWPRQVACYLEQGWCVSIFSVEPPSPTRCLMTVLAGSR
jgi:hypothetical protein